MAKVALITGVTGQDGSYLAELLLEKGYMVHGIKRRASSFNTQRIDHLYMDQHEKHVNFKLHYGDLTDSTNIIRIIQEVQPDEIYNLGAMSHVKVSFDSPEYVANVDGIGTAAQFGAPSGVAVDSSNNLYVTDYGTTTIRKITAAGVVTTLVGTAGTPGSANGTGASALFRTPYGVTVDLSDNLYVPDADNGTIRKIE